MTLNTYRDDVQKFLASLKDKAFDSATIVMLLEQELASLKANLADKEVVDHQVYDCLFLLLELAARNRTDLDAAWERGREKKKKYLPPQ